MSQDVLLLHGLNNNAEIMRDMEHALTARGYHCYNISYPMARFTIHQCAEFVVKKLLPLRAGREDVPLHVVGHSMGGLVGWTIVALLKPDLPWGRVVFIGSPLRGSLLVKSLKRYRLFRWCYGKAACELADYALSLPPLNKPLGCIAGTVCDKLGWIGMLWIGRTGHDGRIMIDETQTDDMTDFLQFPTTHPQLPKEPGVILQVLSFLQTERFCK